MPDESEDKFIDHWPPRRPDRRRGRPDDIIAPIHTAGRSTLRSTTGRRNYDPVKLNIAANCIESNRRRCYRTHTRDEWTDSPASDRPHGEGTISYDVYAAHVHVLNDDIEAGVLGIMNVTDEGRPVFRVVPGADLLSLGR